MSMDPRTTKPPFVPEQPVPWTLHPDILNVSTWDTHQFQLWMGPYDQITGSSLMGGPEGEKAAYVDIINQLVNLAYFHYVNYLDSVEYTREEEKGTSFDDSAE